MKAQLSYLALASLARLLFPRFGHAALQNAVVGFDGVEVWRQQFEMFDCKEGQNRCLTRTSMIWRIAEVGLRYPNLLLRSTGRVLLRFHTMIAAIST